MKILKSPLEVASCNGLVLFWFRFNSVPVCPVFPVIIRVRLNQLPSPYACGGRAFWNDNAVFKCIRINVDWVIKRLSEFHSELRVLYYLTQVSQFMCKTFFCFFSMKVDLFHKTRLNDLLVNQTDAVLEFKSLMIRFASVNSSLQGKMIRLLQFLSEPFF